MCVCVYCLMSILYLICDALYIWGQIKFLLLRLRDDSYNYITLLRGMTSGHTPELVYGSEMKNLRRMQGKTTKDKSKMKP